MGRRKKTEVVEQVTPMTEDTMNTPVEEVAKNVVEETKAEPVEEIKSVKQDKAKTPIAKRINSPSSLVNVRESPNGEVLFRLNNGQKIMVEEEKDGWTKITAYVMSELVGEL